jgi:hypothetical protein
MSARTFHFVSPPYIMRVVPVAIRKPRKASSRSPERLKTVGMKDEIHLDAEDKMASWIISETIPQSVDPTVNYHIYKGVMMESNCFCEILTSDVRDSRRRPKSDGKQPGRLDAYRRVIRVRQSPDIPHPVPTLDSALQECGYEKVDELNDFVGKFLITIGDR